MFRASAIVGLGLQLLQVLPALVGLLLVLLSRASGRWRTWALLSFGLSLAAGLGSFVLTLVLVRGAYGLVGSGVYGLLQGVLGLAALAGSGFGVAAVVADRRDLAPATPQPAPPSA